jgi:hypothetical protein
MSDLTIETRWACESIQGWITVITGSKGDKYRVAYNYDPDYTWMCSCLGFQHRSQCKHIEQAKKQFCGWDQEIDPGKPIDGKCPKCQGPIFSYRVGV